MKNACIITSASSKFFPSLINFLGSIEKNYPNHPDVYIYDLGLFYTFRKELESIPWIHVLDVPHFVPHWRACYTWKTHILHTPLAEYNLYIDAGCQVLRSLDDLFSRIETEGYIAVSQGPTVHIGDITPVEYANTYKLTDQDLQSPVVTAGIFGFSKKSEKIQKVTQELYQSGIDEECLGFSATELWKNKGVNKTSYIRNCKMFRHDTTMLSVILKKNIPDAHILPIEYFSDNLQNNTSQYIWNFRMNYKKLSYIHRHILHSPKYMYSVLNRIYIHSFVTVKRISNTLKQLRRTDMITYAFGMEYMDDMHTYPSATSNIRYYHRLKARIIKKFIEKKADQEKVFLDAGAGHGPYAFLASSLYKKVYCDEFDTSELEYAKKYITTKHISSVEFLHNDLTNTSYPDNHIDVAVCSEVLEHIPEREKAAAELYRILKPGGTLLLSMPQKNSMFYWNVRRIHREYLAQPEPADTSTNLWHFKQHVKFSHTDIENIATRAGFKILRRSGANVLALGERIFTIIYKTPLLFLLYIQIEYMLEKILPMYASFYFIELQKPEK